MLKQHWRLVTKFEQLGDNLVILLAFFVAYYFRQAILVADNSLFNDLTEPLQVLGPLKDYVIVLFIGLALYNVALTSMGAYRSMRFMSFWRLLRIAIAASCVVFLCQAALLYMLKLDLSRSFVAIFCFMSGIGILGERYVTLRLLRYFRLQGKNFRNLLIVGTGQQARKAYIEIVGQPELGLRVRGFISLAQQQEFVQARVNAEQPYAAVKTVHSEVYDLPARAIGGVESFEGTLKRYAIDEVLFTDVAENFQTVRQLASIAVEEGISVSLAADFFSLEILNSDISYFGSLPLIHYQPTPASASALAVKRLMDIGFSAAAIVVLSPLLLATAIAIRIESKGPVLFRQRRVGLNGRIFTLLKFRSMIEDAERMLPELKRYNEMSGPVFKMTDDPRVTRVGRFIRRYSIDELPQLLNVLRGDMSLVGPRPPIPDEVSSYVRKQRRRLSMRPGLTCTWQVSGRNKIPDFDQWAKLDLEYIDNWSLWRDVVLMFRTIPVVFSGSGAR
jgi:exopolysaccharide biosynthesis polyprenyl glycosylphosphotransferase